MRRNPQQRIPVKISVEASADELNRLRPGFSANVQVFPSQHGQRMATLQEP
jgi:multidrug resistance efflux pump